MTKIEPGDHGAMSSPSDTKHIMTTLLEQDPETWARLQGAMAQLALPARNKSNRRGIEILIAPEQWQLVHDVSFDIDGLTFGAGARPYRMEWRFRWSEGVPRWRPLETPVRNRLGDE